MGFTDKELDQIRATVVSDRTKTEKTRWDTPYIEKLLENIASQQFEMSAVTGELESYRRQYLAQRDIADAAISRLERLEQVRKEENKDRDTTIQALKRELKELPAKIRQADGIRCRSCKYVKRSWIFLRCRRYPQSILTWGWWTCGEAAK